MKQLKAFSSLIWLWKSLGENKKSIAVLSIHIMCFLQMVSVFTFFLNSTLKKKNALRVQSPVTAILKGKT